MGPTPSVSDLQRNRFEECFRGHYRDVLAFALRRLANRAAAEDAASETFATAWRRRDQIPADDALPWLYAVALRVIANQRRSAQRKQRLRKRVADEARGRERFALDPAEQVSERRAFFSAFSQLRESDKEILRLVAWDGLAPDQAARVLDCTPATYRVRLSRARGRLSKQLERTEQIAAEGRKRPRVNPAEEVG
jgi:RNA polymerase sigma-70 factor (ECF subfamily)